MTGTNTIKHFPQWEQATHQHSGQLHDYTRTVLELWTAFQSRKPKVSLSALGQGDHVVGIQEIERLALQWQLCVHRAEVTGYWWDGRWIEACEMYAHLVSKLWAKERSILSTGDLESIAAQVMRKHMEKPG